MIILELRELVRNAETQKVWMSRNPASVSNPGDALGLGILQLADNSLLNDD